MIIAVPSTRILGKCDYEICFVRRSVQSRLHPGTCVFPGGVVEPSDATIARKLGSLDSDFAELESKVCAIREVVEETGILLDHASPRIVSPAERKSVNLPTDVMQRCASALQPFGQWETPDDEVRRRGPNGGFSTKFYTAVLGSKPAGVASPDGFETSELFWMAPDIALSQTEELSLPYPQRYTLHELSQCTRLADLTTHCAHLNRGLFKYPFHPTQVPLGNDSFAYAMPGDYMNNKWRPPNGARWNHRGVYTKNSEALVSLRFHRDDEVLRAANASAESGGHWCEPVAGGISKLQSRLYVQDAVS